MQHLPDMDKPQNEPLSETRRSPDDAKRIWQSKQLFGQAREVLIDHGGQTYRLRITRQGKLILCK